MEKEYRLQVRVPRVVLGAPLPETENPFLAVPFEKAVVRAVVSECSQERIDVSNIIDNMKDIELLLNGFYEKLSEAAPGLCIRIAYEAPASTSPSGLYAALTSAISYSVARYNGERLEAWEIVELSRYADPFDPPRGWHHVLDALRYSLATGKPAVYRNDEEFAVIEASSSHPPPRTTRVKPVDAGRLADREIVGGEVYNALVKLTGVLVLEGAVLLREEGLLPLISRLARVQNGITYIGFGASPSGERCMLAPGLPGYLEESCW